MLKCYVILIPEFNLTSILFLSWPNEETNPCSRKQAPLTKLNAFAANRKSVFTKCVITR